MVKHVLSQIVSSTNHASGAILDTDLSHPFHAPCVTVVCMVAVLTCFNEGDPRTPPVPGSSAPAKDHERSGPSERISSHWPIHGGLH